jgi:hypothetical protein
MPEVAPTVITQVGAFGHAVERRVMKQHELVVR